jgi:hypothetical protein
MICILFRFRLLLIMGGEEILVGMVISAGGISSLTRRSVNAIGNGLS